MDLLQEWNGRTIPHYQNIDVLVGNLGHKLIHFANNKERLRPCFHQSNSLQIIYNLLTQINFQEDPALALKGVIDRIEYGQPLLRAGFSQIQLEFYGEDDINGNL